MLNIVQTETSICSSCDYGRSYKYRVERAPLCDYLIDFIHKLRSLPENYMINSVLENFTVLQVASVVARWPLAFTSFRIKRGGSACP